MSSSLARIRSTVVGVVLLVGAVGAQTVTTPSMPLIRADVAPPSSDFTTYIEGELIRVSIPSNWRELPGANAVTFAPDGAYGNTSEQGSFTHGVEIGVARNETHDLATATDELVSTLTRSNPNLSRPSSYEPTLIGGRQGLHAALSNSSQVGEQERIAIFTMLLDAVSSASSLYA